MNKRVYTLWKALSFLLLLMFLSPPFLQPVIPARAAAPACSLDQPYQIFLPSIQGSGTNSGTPQPMKPVLAYQTGKTYLYRYEMLSRVQTAQTNPNGEAASEMNTSIVKGDVEISITGESEGVFDGQIRLVSPVLCLQNDQGDDIFSDDADFLAALQIPLLFKQHQNGVILEVSVPTTSDPQAVNLLKGILTSLQATLQADETYDAIEQSGQGTYRTSYQTQLRADGLHLTRNIDQNSFSTFLTQGDLPDLLLNNRIQTKLDRSTGVFSYIRFDEVIRTEDTQQTDPAELDSVVFWNTASTRGQLKLLQVQDTPAARLAQPGRHTYQVASLAAVFPDPIEPGGLNLDTLNLQAEFDQFQANPENLAQFQRMTNILAQVDGAHAEFETRLTQQLSGDLEITRRYIDLLGADGSAASQEMLAALLYDPATLTNTLKTQALINLALLAEPTQTALDSVQRVLQTSPITEHIQTATLAWGAMAGSLLETHPISATLIAADLRSQLDVAATPEQISLLLNALGNIGQDDLPTLLTPYFSSPDSNAQWAAYWALRHVPGQPAEDLLIAALEDDSLSPFVKKGAALALKNKKGGMSQAAKDKLKNFEAENPTPQGGLFQHNWDKTYGGERVGGSMPGSVYFASPPYSTRLEMQALQEIKYHIKTVKVNLIDKKGQLFSATAWSKPVNEFVQQFYINVTVIGNTLVSEKRDVSCGAQDARNLYNNVTNIFDYSYEYPVWGILIVGVEIKGTFCFKADYNYAWNVCNPLNMSAEIKFEPSAALFVAAGGFAKIWPVRGGISLEADVIKLSLPPALNAVYNITDNFQACLTVPLNIQALSGAIKAWAERKKIGGWKRFLEYNIWEFNVLAYQKDLVSPKCWTP
ncbi:MAG: hypothetical protein OHK0052_05370 [Anaerolineales bacterium]